MWVVQAGTLLSIPDDAPVPHGSSKIDVPDDFHRNPGGFTMKGNELVRRDEPRPTSQSKLTAEEIERIKGAIAEGRI